MRGKKRNARIPWEANFCIRKALKYSYNRSIGDMTSSSPMEDERPTKLTKRHSLDPKVIVSLESSIMRVVNGMDAAQRSTVTKKEAFSMEDFYSTELDTQALEKSKSCCSRSVAVKVKSRRIPAVSEYSVCFSF